jgi:hypothetical protein
MGAGSVALQPLYDPAMRERRLRREARSGEDLAELEDSDPVQVVVEPAA